MSGSGPAEHRRSGSLPRSRVKNLSSIDPVAGHQAEGQVELPPALFSRTSSPASPLYNRDLSQSSVFPVNSNKKEHKRTGSLPRSRARILGGNQQPKGGNVGSRAQSQPPQFHRNGAPPPLRLPDRQFDVTVRSRDNHLLEGSSFQPSYSYRNNRSFFDNSAGDRDIIDSRQTELPRSAPYWSTSTRHFF